MDQTKGQRGQGSRGGSRENPEEAAVTARVRSDGRADPGGEKLQDSGYILKVKPILFANLKWSVRERTESKMTPRFWASGKTWGEAEEAAGWEFSSF